MREEYRREMACQIVHDSWHARGLTSSYVLRAHGRTVGYGSVGGAPRDARDTVKEFFVVPACRGDALPLFRQLVAASGARAVEAQTNDALLLLMLYDCAAEVTSETILFADGLATTLAAPSSGVALRRLTEADRERAFPHTVEPVGEWGLEASGELVATGGLAFHYNPPYGDIYMEVAAAYQRRGLGSYLVQELKRLCYGMGRIPAARCNQANIGSRRTLQRGGMFPCARIVRGRVEACRPVDAVPTP
jgi:GNAT superfamily N-acetyltransferase